MDYPRVLTVQDISCVGQCSLTVALPILSACGLETVILPSAVLSTHTAGFRGFTFRDLTEDIPLITDHWKKENISFDAIYTGYLGSIRQIDEVHRMMDELLKPAAPTVVDPAMANNGCLYSIFDQAFVEKMKTLAFRADYILPNITEACFLTDTPYRETYDENWITELIGKLVDSGAKNVILTGVSYREGKTGIEILEGGKRTYYEHRKLPRSCHGTGDVYSSAFVGALLRGKTAYDAAKIAADYTVLCMEATLPDPDHWYGVKFETQIPKLIAFL
ncbi:MAG: pyridoxamine kinase, partial [Clostridia bacterium]|nr:pyridoxamine kinase [Clostridia bacterium]